MELEAVSFNQSVCEYKVCQVTTTLFDRPLYYLGMEVFTRWFKVDEYLCVDETVIGSWLQVHGPLLCDVMLAFTCFS